MFSLVRSSLNYLKLLSYKLNFSFSIRNFAKIYKPFVNFLRNLPRSNFDKIPLLSLFSATIPRNRVVNLILLFIKSLIKILLSEFWSNFKRFFTPLKIWSRLCEKIPHPKGKKSITVIPNPPIITPFNGSSLAKVNQNRLIEIGKFDVPLTPWIIHACIVIIQPPPPSSPASRAVRPSLV